MDMRSIRLRRNVTQRALAERLGTTQQMIARWESGKAQPNAASLRDLALVLRTTVDAILGRKGVIASETTDPLAWLRRDESGYWGNLGIRLADRQHSIWYPITSATMSRLHSALQSVEAGDWLVFQTLNNKMVAFRPERAEKVTLLDEADDPVSDDWNVGVTDVLGLPLPYYECLCGSVYEKPDPEEFSAQLIEATGQFIEDNELDEPALAAMCLSVRVLFSSARELSCVPSPDSIAEALLILESQPSAKEAMLHLNDGYGCRDLFLSLPLIDLIELPLVQLMKGLEELADGEE